MPSRAVSRPMIVTGGRWDLDADTFILCAEPPLGALSGPYAAGTDATTKEVFLFGGSFLLPDPPAAGKVYFTHDDRELVGKYVTFMWDQP